MYKMAGIAMMLGGAVANALAFTGSTFLFHALSKKEIDEERRRHDLAVENMQKAQIKWQEERQDRIDFINKKLMEEKKSEEKFTELGYAMREYYQVFGKHLESLPPEPKLSDFYTPNNEQHDRELAFITISMIGVGAAIYYYY